MMKRFSSSASSHWPAMASWTASSANWDFGLRFSVDSVFNPACSYDGQDGGRTAPPLQRGFRVYESVAPTGPLRALLDSLAHRSNSCSRSIGSATLVAASPAGALSPRMPGRGRGNKEGAAGAHKYARGRLYDSIPEPESDRHHGERRFRSFRLRWRRDHGRGSSRRDPHRRG